MCVAIKKSNKKIYDKKTNKDNRKHLFQSVVDGVKWFNWLEPRVKDFQTVESSQKLKQKKSLPNVCVDGVVHKNDRYLTIELFNWESKTPKESPISQKDYCNDSI